MRGIAEKVTLRSHLQAIDVTCKNVINTIDYMKKVTGHTYFLLIRKDKLNIIFYIYTVLKGCDLEASVTNRTETLVT